MEESEAWERDGYQHFSGDWLESDENENWKPPMELIMACEEAQVCLGVWLHPERKFKLVVPGGTWFKDSWEDSWKDSWS